jgi:hypothetical protein
LASLIGIPFNFKRLAEDRAMVAGVVRGLDAATCPPRTELPVTSPAGAVADEALATFDSPASPTDRQVPSELTARRPSPGTAELRGTTLWGTTFCGTTF